MAATGPQTDLESEGFWRALGEHRLILQRCDDCGRLRFPPMPTCPYCASRSWQEQEAGGRGEIYSLVTVHQALSPATAGDVPYTVATVQLDEGPRVLARVEPALDAAIGMVVEACFVDHEGWSELRFAPALRQPPAPTPAGTAAVSGQHEDEEAS